MEALKGASLRRKQTKRPAISAPKVISVPEHANSAASINPKLAVPKQLLERRDTSEKTSDLVKKRYSTRFTNLPADFGNQFANAPTLPTIPQGYGEARDLPDRSKGSVSAGTIKVDMAKLGDPKLNAEQYVTDLLANATEEEMRDFQKSLQKIRNRTSTDLQANVYQNRNQFIRISKEADRLKAEMKNLRSLIFDLKTHTETLKETTSQQSQMTTSNSFPSLNSEAAEEIPEAMRRGHRNRSSIADLTALHAVQMQALWKNVEGSQKFLPAAPGRHVLRDSSNWVELNSATWKARRSIHIFLLNDNLLVATRKKIRVEQSAANSKNTPSKLVADRCWSLMDIEIVDLSASAVANASGAKSEAMMNAINIRVGQESFTYKNQKNEEKVGLLLAFKKALDELKKSVRAQNDNKERVTDTLSYFTSRDPSLLKKGNLLENLSESMAKDRPSILIEVDGKQQNLRWVEGQMDDLDVLISLQRFDDAVVLVEKMRGLSQGLKGNTIAQDLINFKTDERAAKVAALIAKELVHDHTKLLKVKENTNWLSRLGFQDRAREVYLEARSTNIKLMTRKVIFEGDLAHYIWQISYIYFKLIQNTVEVYQECFPHSMMSACVKWSKFHVDEHNAILATQLSSIDKDSPEWGKCMEMANRHGQLLREVGIRFQPDGSTATSNGKSSSTFEALTSSSHPIGLGLN